LSFPHGLYETLITEGLAEALARLEQDLVDKAPLSNADAADRFARHLDRIVRRVIAALPDDNRASRAVDLGHELLETMQRFARDKELTRGDQVKSPVEVLRVVKTRLPDGSTRAPASPRTPLLDTALLTNAPGADGLPILSWFGDRISAELRLWDAIDQHRLVPFAYFRYT
jgi:hypothetical protein